MTEVVHWNAKRPPRPLRRVPRPARRLLLRWEDNFGDLLGPIVVRRLAERAGRDPRGVPGRRLLCIGSILHEARAGDVVWGTGRNGRVESECHDVRGLDIRAVRGPMTRDWLAELGVDCPEVYGDPALLLPMLRPDLVELAMVKRRRVTFVRHIDDPLTRPRRGVHMIAARADLEKVLRTIVQSELVVSTSLHAVIVAEAFGVPARSIRSVNEPEFKFADHYLGTGRPQYARSDSIEEAIAAGGERGPTFDPAPLLAAFPYDLFPEIADVDGERE